MTNAVKQELCLLRIECAYVPANMTHFFQPLDLMVNGSGKQFKKKKFVTYYSDAVKQQLESGKNLEDVEVNFCLSVIKPESGTNLEDVEVNFCLSVIKPDW